MNSNDSKKASISPVKSSLFRKLVRDTRGANLVEYIMLVGLIAILCIVAFNQFGGAVRTKLDQEKGAIDGINSTAGGGG